MSMPDDPPATALDTIRRANKIAVRDLRACYNPDGIVAGRMHFNAYWARDGFWALFGSLALGDHDQARAQLDTFIRYQLPSGALPVRIDFIGNLLGPYHKRRSNPKARFRAGTIFSDPLDPAALFIIAAREYHRRVRDWPFCERFDSAMDRAVRWLMQHDRDGDAIIENRYLADWMDSILKKDKLFNVNVIYYEGLRACEMLKRELGRGDEADQFREIAERLHTHLQEVFWNGEFFTDWVRGSRRGGFSADGNVLAIFFGLAREEQSRQILSYIADHGLDADAPLRTCHPVYPLSQVFPWYIVTGLSDYHRALIWPWLGTLNAVNKARLGQRDQAIADLARIGEWYLRANVVGEVYERDGRPVSQRLYQSEAPFAWNAGLYIHALHELGLAGDSGPA